MLPTINGAEVRSRRRSAGLTLQELGERIGCSRSHLSEIEAGRKTPSLPLAAELAEAFGCKVDDLLTSARSGGAS
jgi:transcriptional regulator with XRE-family HTH domain